MLNRWFGTGNKRGEPKSVAVAVRGCGRAWVWVWVWVWLWLWMCACVLPELYLHIDGLCTLHSSGCTKIFNNQSHCVHITTLAGMLLYKGGVAIAAVEVKSIHSFSRIAPKQKKGDRLINHISSDFISRHFFYVKLMNWWRMRQSRTQTLNVHTPSKLRQGCILRTAPKHKCARNGA